jgi:hypothetical protein
VKRIIPEVSASSLPTSPQSVGNPASEAISYNVFLGPFLSLMSSKIFGFLSRIGGSESMVDDTTPTGLLTINARKGYVVVPSTEGDIIQIVV